ncbi:MAG: FAD-dependent oxidoreductase [Candidatus Omnitrophota bacterium]|jgi:NADH dehydrogenase
MKKAVIIGGGFAGLSAAKRFFAQKGALSVTLIDRKPTFDFLPALPDIIGRNIAPAYLKADIKAISRRLGFDFINEEVIGVDLAQNKVNTVSSGVYYDYLLISSGSQTNFYGNAAIEKNAYLLDRVDDAAKIARAVKENGFTDFVVCGGGYTGIELATNLKKLLNRLWRTDKVVIVERQPDILGPLPQWMKDYARDNLRRLDIEILAATTVEHINGREIMLSGGRGFDNAMLIWAAGVKSGDFIRKMDLEKNPQGRLKVDEYLRINRNCYAAGDAALFSYRGGTLRMAVQFSIMEGLIAAVNILRDARGMKPAAYLPVDLGYVIPMANDLSCGSILGMDLKGRIPTALHYFMCLYRSYGWNNKAGFAKDLLRGGGR